MTNYWTQEDGKPIGYLKMALLGSKYSMLNLYRWPAKAKFHEPAHMARVAGWDVKVRESA